MPSRVLETVLTGRNLLSPVLAGAGKDVEAFNVSVTEANTQSAAGAETSAAAQETAAAKVVEANTRVAESAKVSGAESTAAQRSAAEGAAASADAQAAASTKVVESNAKVRESSLAMAETTDSTALRTAASWQKLATVGLPLVGVAVAAVTGKMAGDYQQLVTKLETTAGESKANLGMVSQGMLDMAGKVGISADELAKGMYTVESAGYHGAAALNIEKAAAQGAKQENADLAKVTDAVTTALHDYNLPASQAATVTSQMITAVSAGKTTFDELTGSLHSVTPLAAALHVPFSDIIGDVAAMTASGESADQATQNMADALRHLQNPTSIMTAELAQLGITSSNLADDLSSKGLSGTIQEISTAIVSHLDPATQKVLLPALNQSKTAAQDLQVMLGSMPPSLRQMSQALLDGSGNIHDYRGEVQAMGGQAAAMGLNFLSLYERADGFNQLLKSGSPAAQAYSAALQKAMGDSSGLTVALQLTGEHADAVNASIKNIAGSAGDASGNIKGWSEVQGNFNQKLSEAEAGAKSLAIEAGQHLLPALTAGIGWVADHGVPDLEGFGHTASGVAQAVAGIPAPVRDMALAFAAVRVLDMVGIFDRINSGTGRLSQGLTAAKDSAIGFRDEISVQQALMQAEARDASLAAAGLGDLDRALGLTAASGDSAAASLSRVQMMLFGLDEGLAATVAEEEAATAATGRFSAALATAGARGGAMLSSGLSGAMNMLGGPWGVAMLGATGAFIAFEQTEEKSTEQTQKWVDALKKGGDAAQQASSQMKSALAGIDTSSIGYKLANTNNSVLGSIQELMPGFGQLHDKVRESAGAAQEAKTQYDAYRASMTEVDFATQRVSDAEQRLGQALRNGNPTTIAAARDELAQAETNLAGATERSNNAQRTQNQLLQDQGTKALAAADAALGVREAQNQLALAVEQYNTDVTSGHLSTLQLQQEQFGLVDSAKQAAQAASDAAVAQAKQNGATDTATTGQAAYKQALMDAAKTLTGPARDAVLNLAQSLDVSTSSASVAAEKMTNLGITVHNIPNSHFIEIDAPTAAQEAQLAHLGYVTTTLPNGHVVVTANTNPAMDEIQNLLAWGRAQTINIRTTSTVGVNTVQQNTAGAGLSKPGAAIGGVLHAYETGGIYTPMPGGVADVVKANTYRLIGDRVRDDEFYIPDNDDARSLKIGAEYVRRHPDVAMAALGMGSGASYNAAGTGFTAAASPGYGPAATASSGAVIDYGRLGQAVAAAMQATGGTGRSGALVEMNGVTIGDQGDANQLAERLAYIGRTRGW